MAQLEPCVVELERKGLFAAHRRRMQDAHARRPTELSPIGVYFDRAAFNGHQRRPALDACCGEAPELRPEALARVRRHEPAEQGLVRARGCGARWPPLRA